MSLLEVSGPSRSAQRCRAAVRDVSFSLARRRAPRPHRRVRLGQVADLARRRWACCRRRSRASGSHPPRRRTRSWAPPTALCARCAARSPQIVFQEPLTALDPLMRVGRQIAEPLRRHLRPARGGAARGRRRGARRSRACPTRRIARAFPHELSGGQRQRVAIAIALAARPRAADRRRADDGARRDRAGRGPLACSTGSCTSAGWRSCSSATTWPSSPAWSSASSCMRDGVVVEEGEVMRDPARAAASVHGRARRERAGAGRRPGCCRTERRGIVVTVLELRSAGFSYGAQTVLDDSRCRSAKARAVGLVGESGAGKSTILRLLLGLAAPQQGEVLVRRGAARTCATARSCAVSGQAVQPVFQDPYSSLDPRQRIDRIVGEPLRSLRLAKGPDARTRVAEALASVGLARRHDDAVPARVLRRPAPAHRDRPRDRLPPAGAAGRRAGERPGRHHPRAGDRPARAAAGASTGSPSSWSRTTSAPSPPCASAPWCCARAASSSPGRRARCSPPPRPTTPAPS